MARSALGTLGSFARWARGHGLGLALRAARDGIDFAFVRVGFPPLAATVDGVTLRGYLRHRSFLAHVASGTYEPAFRRRFADALEPGATVFDAGAHIGLYTLLACRRVGPTGCVIAAEPDPYNARALEWNVRHAGCTNVTVVRKAVSDSPGSATFHQSLGTISSSFTRRAGRGPFRELETDVTTVDRELEGRSLGALVVKLDVEGAETRALAGLAASVSRAGSAAVFVESNPTALAADGTDHRGLVEQIRALGLEPTTIEGDDSDPAKPVNLYCVRSS